VSYRPFSRVFHFESLCSSSKTAIARRAQAIDLQRRGERASP